MKKSALLIICIIACISVYAQPPKGMEIGVGIDGGFPVGGFGLKSNPGIGGDAQLGYNFNSKYALVVNAGYMAFYTTDKLHDESNIGYVSDGFIKIGARYVFPSRMYVLPQIGFSDFSGQQGNNVQGNGFTYAASLGYFADKKKTLDVSIRYESTTNKETITFVGIRFACLIGPGMFF